MKQRTAKRAVEAWHWLHNNPHHIVGTEFNDDSEQSTKAVFFQNHHDKLRVPAALLPEVMAGIKPNTRAFDTRMYMLRPAARRAVT